MTTIGNSTVTISNATLATHPDGNTVTAYRSDTNSTININIGDGSTADDITNALNAVALHLAQQDAVGAILTQTLFTGTATSDKGQSTVILHPYSYTANPDGLVVLYTLSSTATQVYNVNVSTCSGTDQDALNAYAAATITQLQGIANSVAQTLRDAADAGVGILGLIGSASASVTV